VDAVRILLAGLAFQAFSFLIFMLIFLRAAYNNYKQSSLSDDREESEKVLVTEFESGSRPIRPLFFFVLGLSSVAIWTRTLFRVGETIEGVSVPAFVFHFRAYAKINSGPGRCLWLCKHARDTLCRIRVCSSHYRCRTVGCLSLVHAPAARHRIKWLPACSFLMTLYIDTALI
jgi:hypothetical protein